MKNGDMRQIQNRLWAIVDKKTGRLSTFSGSEDPMIFFTRKRAQTFLREGRALVRLQDVMCEVVTIKN